MGSSLSCLSPAAADDEKKPSNTASSSKRKPAVNQSSRSRPSPSPGSRQQQQAGYQQAGKDGYQVLGQLGSQEGTVMKLMRNKKTKELVAAKWIPRVQVANALCSILRCSLDISSGDMRSADQETTLHMSTCMRCSFMHDSVSLLW